MKCVFCKKAKNKREKKPDIKTKKRLFLVMMSLYDVINEIAIQKFFVVFEKQERNGFVVHVVL